jgi:C-terminal processing protease CtpA/Prc
MKATRRDVLALAAGATALGAWPASAQTGNEPGDLRAAQNSADFDLVWELVRDRFYDPSLHGLDWQGAKARYRPQAIAAHTREDGAAAINAMLGELGASHTHYYTPEDPA